MITKEIVRSYKPLKRAQLVGYEKCLSALQQFIHTALIQNFNETTVGFNQAILTHFAQSPGK